MNKETSMKEADKTTSPGYHRGLIYGWLKDIGFELSEDHRRQLKSMLKEMCNARTKDLQQRLLDLNNKNQGEKNMNSGAKKHKDDGHEVVDATLEKPKNFEGKRDVYLCVDCSTYWYVNEKDNEED